MNYIKEIRLNTKNALLSLNIPVHTSRVRSVDIANTPCVVIYNDSQSISNEMPSGIYAQGPISHSLCIDAVVAYSGEFADELDDLVQDIVELISQETYLQSTWISLDQIDIQYQYVGDSERPLAVANIKLTGITFKE